MNKDEQKRENFTLKCYGLGEGISEYVNNAEIPGLDHLVGSRTLFAKIFWCSTFVFAIVFLGFFVKEAIDQFYQRSIILVENLRPTNIFEIPFPAVTVCPQFKIKSEYYTYDKTREYLMDRGFSAKKPLLIKDLMQFILAIQICDPLQAETNRQILRNYHNFTNLNKNYVALLQQLSPYKSSMIRMSQFQEEQPQPGKQFFHPVLTNEGVCFTFNMVPDILRENEMQTDYVYHNVSEKIIGWDFMKGYYAYPSYPRRSWAVGEPFSLQVTLFAWNKDLLNSCAASNLGYKMRIHSPQAYPSTFENYIPIQHQTNIKIKIKPEIVTTAPNLREYTPQQRQCFFKEERKLQFFKYYNVENCKLECFANYTLAKFKCVHFSLPRAPNTPICGSNIDFPKAYANCENFELQRHFFEHDRCSIHNQLKGEPNLKCTCLPECDTVNYEYRFDTYGLSEFQKPTEREAKETFFTIFFEKNTIYGYTRRKLHSFADVVSDFGGLVGLFIGASIISVFELVYLCCLKPCMKRCNRSSV